MATPAGTLWIEMATGLARLTDDMQKAKQIVGSTMNDINTSVGQAKRVLGELGVGLGIGYFVSLIKGSIDAMDRLHDLNKTTNITVETLAGLNVAAKQSGGDIESIAGALNKLSQNMGKDAEKFKALGISAKDPLEAFKQLADLFVNLEDPQQRAATMAAALGKAWAGAAPLLAEGGQKIGELVTKGTELSGVTTELAKQADELNDKWVLLGGTGGILVRLVGPLLPLLNTLADHMLQVQERSAGMSTGFSPLLEVMKVVLVIASDVSFVFQQMGKDIAGLIEVLKLYAKGEFAQGRAIGEMFKKDAAAARKALDEYQARVMAMGTTPTAPGAAPAARDPAAAADAAARAAEFLGKERRAKEQAEAEKFHNELLRLAKAAADAELKVLEDAENQAQAIRDIARRVREEDDKRELEQIKFKNEEIAKMEKEGMDARLAQIDLEQEQAIERAAALQAADPLSGSEKLVQLQESLMMTELAEQESFERRLEFMHSFSDEELNALGGRQAIEEGMTQMHAAKLVEIERNKNQAVRSMEMQTLNLAAGLLQVFAGKSKAAAIAVIAINKAIAIGLTIQNTAAAVMRAMMELGPVFGPPAAAWIKTLGAMQVGIIAATGLAEAASLGGGGASLGSPANPISTTSGAVASTESVGQQQQGQPTVVLVRLENLPADGALLTGKQFRRFLEQVAEEMPDGGRMVVG